MISTTTSQTPFQVTRAGILAAAMAAAAVFGGTAAQAATQGSLGATSSGSVTITASVPNRTQISSLSDINFANVDPSSTATSTQSNCVWSNTATKGYSIKATGSGTAGAFTLISGALTPVPYSVQWSQSSGQASGTAMTAGTTLSGQVTTAVTPTCSTAPSSTSSLIVSIAATDLQGMVATTSYSGTLTLLVTPQ